MRNWRNASAHDWCINIAARLAGLSLALGLALLPCTAQSAKSPLLVLLGGDVKAWRAECQQRGWQFLEPIETDKSADQLVKGLAAKVEETAKSPSVDANRVYLAAQGASVSTLFYVASRMPDLWAAAVGAGGSPRSAIDSNRLYAANSTNLPVLWLFANKEEEPLGKRLKDAGFNLEWRQPEVARLPDIFDWLASHEREPFPSTADCETGSPLFTRCYWAEVTKFDPGERNDVLASTRVPPLGSGALLAVGPFGMDAADKGPGVVVASLPDKYTGPLKLNDRIVEMGGKDLKDAADYTQTLYQTFEEKPVVVMIARGKEHIRLETKIVVAPRPEPVTARVRAQYLPDLQEVEVVSRSIKQMRVTLPAVWLPVKLNWNGTELATATEGGCWLLDEQKELLSGKRCP